MDSGCVDPLPSMVCGIPGNSVREHWVVIVVGMNIYMFLHIHTQYM